MTMPSPLPSESESLLSGARAVLSGNRHTGLSTWGGRFFSFICPSNLTYPFQWLWDSCFHAIALTHLDIPLAQSELFCLLQAARPDGMIPHMILWEREEHLAEIATYNLAMLDAHLTAITQPPLVAQAVARVYAARPDPLFLRRVLPVVKAYYRWWLRERDPDGDYLVAIIQPDESGLDASPKYDSLLRMPSVDIAGLRASMERIFAAYAPLRASPRELMASGIFLVEDVMMNSFYADGLRSLAGLCRTAGELDEGEEFDHLASHVEAALVEKCYDREHGIFYDLDGLDETPARVKTVTSLLPLILKHLDPAIARRLVVEHLANPKEFWLPYPIPSVAADEPSFDPEGETQLLWRGPTWVNLNWFLARGLTQHGFPELAAELSRRTRDMVARSGWWEYFNPYTGQGCGAPNFGWTTLVIDLTP